MTIESEAAAFDRVAWRAMNQVLEERKAVIQDLLSMLALLNDDQLVQLAPAVWNRINDALESVGITREATGGDGTQWLRATLMDRNRWDASA